MDSKFTYINLTVKCLSARALGKYKVTLPDTQGSSVGSPSSAGCK